MRPRDAERPVTPRRLLDYRASLWVRCAECRHDAAVPVGMLIERGLGDRPVDTLRFRCTLCGSTVAHPRLDSGPM